VDVAFTRARLADFIDGCFWHRCPIHGTQPARNYSYWASKLDRTVARDGAVDAALSVDGWMVLRFWEHDEPVAVADVVAHELVPRAAHR
jgi:DNA mismatch endonuclease (patch repair protein)